MRQDFSGVTAEELSRLFPVILEEHRPEYFEQYAEEKAFLASILGDKVLRISHIGSTSVPGLLAKPTVDVLLEITEDTDIPVITEILRDEGYIVNHANNDIITYIKGYTPRGFEGQTFHVHVRAAGDWGEMYFRDYLINHPDTAAEYAALKRQLQRQFEYDRDGYTAAKGEFVQKITALARNLYPDRYNPQKNT